MSRVYHDGGNTLQARKEVIHKEKVKEMRNMGRRLMETKFFVASQKVDLFKQMEKLKGGLK